MTNKNFWRVIVSAVMLICTCIIVSSTANAEEVIVFDNTTVSYTVQQGAVYYESSWRNGTGATGVIGGKYANGNPCYVHVDGYSVLDNDGNILKSYFEEKKLLLEIPKKHDGEILMVHISGADPNGGYRLGWISYDSISRITTGTYQAIEIESKKDIRIEKIPEKKVEETVDIVKEKIAEDVVKTR